LHQQLKITRKTSVEYATSINLLATIVGWLSFFLLKNLLPQPLKTQIISYIFFDRLLEPQPVNWHLLIAVAGIGIFFCAFLIKLTGLVLLKAMIEKVQVFQASSPRHQGRRRLSDPWEQVVSRPRSNQAFAVLIANAYSHSAILLFLLVRFLQLNPII